MADSGEPIDQAPPSDAAKRSEALKERLATQETAAIDLAAADRKRNFGIGVALLVAGCVLMGVVVIDATTGTAEVGMVAVLIAGGLLVVLIGVGFLWQVSRARGFSRQVLQQTRDDKQADDAIRLAESIQDINRRDAVLASLALGLSGVHRAPAAQASESAEARDRPAG